MKQVHQIAGGTDIYYDNSVGIGVGYTSQPWNNGCTTWGASQPCSDLAFTNMDIHYRLGSGALVGSWWHSACTTPVTTGSDFQNTALSADDYRVTL